MSYGVASAMVGAASQAQLAASSPIESQTDRNAGSKVAELKQWANTDQSAGTSIKTERADAVQATPATSPAAVIEFNKEPAFDADMPEYPIFGPDKFARTMAVRNAASMEEAASEPKPQENKQALEDLAKIVEQVKASDGTETGGIAQPETQSDLSPMVAPIDAQDNGADVARLVEQNSNAANAPGAGVTETAAEAGEADLTS